MSDTIDLCGCIRCVDKRMAGSARDVFLGPMVPGWRYACEQCGNKRCPHHTDHTLACTGSNEPGQPGSVYQ